MQLVSIFELLKFISGSVRFLVGSRFMLMFMLMKDCMLNQMFMFMVISVGQRWLSWMYWWLMVKVCWMSSVNSVIMVSMLKKLSFLVIMVSRKLVCVLGRQNSFLILVLRLMLNSLLCLKVISECDNWQLCLQVLVYGFMKLNIWLCWQGEMMIMIVKVISSLMINSVNNWVLRLLRNRMFMVMVIMMMKVLKFGFLSNSMLMKVMVLNSGRKVCFRLCMMLILWMV